jgi:hypothetical protein
MATKTRTNTQGKDQQVITGVQKDLTLMSSLPLGGQTFTPATLVAFVQSRIDAGNEVVVAKANWQSAAKAYEAINTKANVVVHDLKQLVIGAFGATSSKLADFGFTAKKVTVLTPEQKVAAAEKRAATRKARNTLGPKAKLAVTGTVPPTAPATPAKPEESAAPAPAPTVTVNVTSTPTTPAGVSTTTTATTPAPAPTPVAPTATAEPPAPAAPVAPAKS